ncbi:thiamine pyrophosphate-dependent enzyme, partial [Burkholderia contaminans]|uniref:thiamine pyrophosphate-dependent enzyme n=1 Tax=Burkholderia contaminans TaxID=488447 RepID=UPI001E2DDACB
LTMIARSHNLCRTRRPNLQLSVGHCLGDGSTMYSPQAIYSAVQLDLPITFVILNNARYAALQEFAPVFGFSASDPVQGTDLPGLDFVALANSMGCKGVRVSDALLLKPALEDALSSGKTCLVEIVVA